MARVDGEVERFGQLPIQFRCGFGARWFIEIEIRPTWARHGPVPRRRGPARRRAGREPCARRRRAASRRSPRPAASVVVDDVEFLMTLVAGEHMTELPEALPDPLARRRLDTPPRASPSCASPPTRTASRRAPPRRARRRAATRPTRSRRSRAEAPGTTAARGSRSGSGELMPAPPHVAIFEPDVQAVERTHPGPKRLRPRRQLVGATLSSACRLGSGCRPSSVCRRSTGAPAAQACGRAAVR